MQEINTKRDLEKWIGLRNLIKNETFLSKLRKSTGIQKCSSQKEALETIENVNCYKDYQNNYCLVSDTYDRISHMANITRFLNEFGLNIENTGVEMKNIATDGTDPYQGKKSISIHRPYATIIRFVDYHI